MIVMTEETEVATEDQEETITTKILDNKRLVAEKTTASYQQEFRSLFMALNDNPDYTEWMDLYKKLVYWELEMKKSDSPEMQEVFQTQKHEANTEFFKFISKNYSSWVAPKSTAAAPIMSHNLLKFKVLPHLEKDVPLFFILIDIGIGYWHWIVTRHALPLQYVGA